jgi:hypothetical protein
MPRIFALFICFALAGCATGIGSNAGDSIDSFASVCLAKNGEETREKRSIEDGWFKVESSADPNLAIVKLGAIDGGKSEFQAFSSSRHKGKFLVIFSSQAFDDRAIKGCELYDFSARREFSVDRLVQQFGPHDDVPQQASNSGDGFIARTWSSEQDHPRWMSQFVSAEAKIPQGLPVPRGAALRAATLEIYSQPESQ